MTKIEKIVSNYLESNTYVLKKASEAIIIDAGAEVKDVCEKVGNSTVLGILLTHGHFDHCVNAVELAKKLSCKIYASKFAKQTLEDPGKNYGETFKITDFSNFIFLDMVGEFSLGNFRIYSHIVPGHSKCSLCYLIDGVLFSGDVVFEKGIGRMDLFGGSREELLSSLELIQSLKFDTLASGHGELSNFEEQERNLKLFIRYLSR